MDSITQWKEKIDTFIKLSNKHNVRMIMVGGGAVNFHGYQRHSADVDFWIDVTQKNLNGLIRVFREMGYEINDFPDDVKEQKQNISIKFSPVDIDLELITNFSSDKTFEEVYKDSESVVINNNEFLKWNVISYEDLINSKIKAQRPKDLLDVQQLQEIKKDIEKRKGEK
ncbi:putative nucleotidyltransferase component of viral defense system [Aquimarina sp. EL_43]|uniref:nucleotidyl transferase AbiEii/AbiGii toxin family protein n=1 Tax=unclassified Aquimarina TaxID=2627091 RepID=UPI0018CB7C32|nr:MULTISPECIES: nucleotidyl transferase AbiEii/AbiGii toxin family protein [unclassified Aquimarina]MBG6129924.1 putative nucleotidyltransferase component of viral defense system [Aquimarina sp. EL_35]MBG6148704.1 putative nucleotidyltransferase component of viral defense system [Aquimarina sp. EL_32]MBG6168922.1 putative nucleotidyltransferase component of viral defense system [Aquimarina sp. EL_43]